MVWRLGCKVWVGNLRALGQECRGVRGAVGV